MFLINEHDPRTYKIIFPAGNNIVQFNPESKTQSYFYPTPGTVKITCLCVSPSKRFLAWAEESETGIITIQDLNTHKRKALTSIESGSRVYVDLSFGKEEGKSFVSLAGPPEWTLIFWDLNKLKPLSSVKIPVSPSILHSIFHHPREEDLIIVMGNNYLKTFKLMAEKNVPDSYSIQQKVLLMSKKDPKDFPHSPNYISKGLFKDGSFVIGTDNGEILFFNPNCDFKYILSTSPGDGFPINTILPFSKGFLVGGSSSLVYIFEKKEAESKNLYSRLEKKIQYRESYSQVNSLLLTTSEEHLLIGLNNGQLIQVNFNYDRGFTEDNIRFEPFIQLFHSGKIHSIDVAVRKPLVATVGEDKFVKIWNYYEKQLEINQIFDEEGLAVAFHPSGFHLVVAFQEKIKMFNILDKTLQVFKEIPVKGCSVLSFSNGGNLFALANSNIIQVYNFFTGENPPHYVFRGHVTRVKSIVWQEDDMGFFSGSSEGTIYEFRLDDNSNKTHMYTAQGQQILDLAVAPKTILMCSDVSNSTADNRHLIQLRYYLKVCY